MAGVKNSDIQDVFEFEREMWDFIKATWIPEYSKEYWNHIKNEANNLLEKYKNDFCVASVCLYIEYLKWKHKKYSGETKLDFNTWIYKEREKMFESKLRSINEKPN